MRGNFLKQSFLVVVFFVVFLFLTPSKSYALDPIDQNCQNGIAGSDRLAYSDHEPAQSFAPSKNTISAIAVYIKTDFGGTSDVTLKLVDATQTGGIIASKTQSVGSEYSWVVFEFGNVHVNSGWDYGIYLTSSANAVWKMTENCYDGGYAVWDGQAHLMDDYGFAVYGHDETAAAVPSDASNTQNNGVSDSQNEASPAATDLSASSGDSSIQSQNSGDASSTSKKSSGALFPGKTQVAGATRTPTADELKAEILKDFQKNKGGGGMFSPILSGFILWILIFFVVVAFGVGALILIVMSRRKNSQNPAGQSPLGGAPPQPSQAQEIEPEKPEEEKPKPEPAEKEVESEKPAEKKAEVKEATPVEKRIITQKPAKKSSKSKAGLVIVLVIVIVLILLGIGGFYIYRKIAKSFKGLSISQDTENVEDKEYKATLKPIKAQTDTDKSRSVTKTVSSAGAVLQTQGADGTLYTLTVPVDAIILTSELTMTPLTNVPVSDYKNKVVGGVVLSGNFDFIRPTYLSIQPNRQKPEKKPAFSYCVVGSRGFDPEVCAGLAGVPFTFGVAPGKIVAFSSQSGKEDAQAFLEPTIYTGMKDTYTAQVLYPGAYFADNANKQDIEKFAQTTFALGADITNKTEVLMQLATLGGKLDPYKAEIKRFKKGKTDYPREVLKSAMLARAIGDKEIAKKRTDDYYNIISMKSKNIRSSYMPIIRYAGLIRQVNNSAAKKHRFAKNSSNIAYAIDEFVSTGNGGNENYDQPIPDYEGDNGVDYGDGTPPRTWQDIWNELSPPGTTPPDLQDWSDAEAEAAAQKKADDELEKNCRDELNAKYITACEKAQAIRTIIALGRMKGTDYDSFSGIINQCAKDCSTMEECEDMGDLGDKWGNGTIRDNAANSIQEFLLKNNQECDLAHKKGLADYGNNSCEVTDTSASEEVVPLGPPSLDL